MCGIVAAVSNRDIISCLVSGLQRLEYRGYDSAGLATLSNNKLALIRVKGKVATLDEAVKRQQISGKIGIAHTRWATHGKPSESNAHPHVSNNRFAVVHNGIIENYESIREKLAKLNYEFQSETDTEAVVHFIHHLATTQNMPFLKAVQMAIQELSGAFALAILDAQNPEECIIVRRGSPLVIGLGENENFAASDPLALLPFTNRFVYLEEGDVAVISRMQVNIYNNQGEKVERLIHQLQASNDVVSRGNYRHFMLKEIFEQPEAIEKTLEGRIFKDKIFDESFGEVASRLFDATKRVKIVACGTSYYAGLIAKYWIEEIAGLSVNVEIASEYRYRNTVVEPDTLLVTLSQSGETADTLAALRKAKKLPYVGTLAICNVAQSSLVRESDTTLLMRAGPEIGVASTKAFTAQLISLLMLTGVLAKRQHFTQNVEAILSEQLFQTAKAVQAVLDLDPKIKALAPYFADKQHALFLGRAAYFPIALEGALKLKEISYIHAEAYPAGELKHGPLALVDKNMPVIVIAPNDELFEKIKSNLEEVRARGGHLIVFSEKGSGLKNTEHTTIIEMPTLPKWIAPIAYAIPMQLLAYHVAIIKGTDVDQPRNLAKSVTVE